MDTQKVLVATGYGYFIIGFFLAWIVDSKCIKYYKSDKKGISTQLKLIYLFLWPISIPAAFIYFRLSLYSNGLDK